MACFVTSWSLGSRIRVCAEATPWYSVIVIRASQKIVKPRLFSSIGFGFLGDQERIREIAWQWQTGSLGVVYVQLSGRETLLKITDSSMICLGKTDQFPFLKRILCFYRLQAELEALDLWRRDDGLQDLEDLTRKRQLS